MKFDVSLGITGILTIIFVAAKLAGYITWPWLWVLAPTWIGIGLGLLILLSIGLFFLMVFLMVLIAGIIMAIWD